MADGQTQLATGSREYQVVFLVQLLDGFPTLLASCRHQVIDDRFAFCCAVIFTSFRSGHCSEFSQRHAFDIEGISAHPLAAVHRVLV